MTINANEISCLCYQEGAQWIAQGLEFDITAQAPSLPEVHERFVMKLIAEYVIALDLEREPFTNVAAAPDHFWRMYHDAKMTVSAEPTPVRIGDDGYALSRLFTNMKIGRPPAAMAAA